MKLYYIKPERKETLTRQHIGGTYDKECFCWPEKNEFNWTPLVGIPLPMMCQKYMAWKENIYQNNLFGITKLYLLVKSSREERPYNCNCSFLVKYNF